MADFFDSEAEVSDEEDVKPSSDEDEDEDGEEGENENLDDLINDEEEEDDQGGSDSDEEIGKKKKRKRREIDDRLEDDDYELIEENTGVKVERKKFRRVKQISDEEDSEDEDGNSASLMEAHQRDAIAKEIFQEDMEEEEDEPPEEGEIRERDPGEDQYAEIESDEEESEDCCCKDDDHCSEQRRERREENKINFQISAQELLLLGKSLYEEKNSEPAGDSTGTRGRAVDPMCTPNETLSSPIDEHSELPVDLIMSALLDIKADMREIKSDMRKLMAGQKALRQSVTYIYSKMTQKSVARSQATTPIVLTSSSLKSVARSQATTPIVLTSSSLKSVARSQATTPHISTSSSLKSVVRSKVTTRIVPTSSSSKSVARSQLTTPIILTPSSSKQPSSSGHAGSTPSSSQRPPAQDVTPRYITTSENTYLMGGVEGLQRHVPDYKMALKKVLSRGASRPDAMGRLMCSVLVRMEFSEIEMAQKNVTGKTRNPMTKKLLYIPKLDPKIIDAIFRQAKLQFPEFSDCVSDVSCPTVHLINDTCKHIRQRLEKLAQQH